jgi:hypothetical protein
MGAHIQESRLFPLGQVPHPSPPPLLNTHHYGYQTTNMKTMIKRYHVDGPNSSRAVIMTTAMTMAITTTLTYFYQDTESDVESYT